MWGGTGQHGVGEGCILSVDVMHADFNERRKETDFSCRMHRSPVASLRVFETLTLHDEYMGGGIEHTKSVFQISIFLKAPNK